jgi:hypothetical protein
MSATVARPGAGFKHLFEPACRAILLFLQAGGEGRWVMRRAPGSFENSFAEVLASFEHLI